MMSQLILNEVDYSMIIPTAVACKIIKGVISIEGNGLVTPMLDSQARFSVDLKKGIQGN